MEGMLRVASLIMVSFEVACTHATTIASSARSAFEDRRTACHVQTLGVTETSGRTWQGKPCSGVPLLCMIRGLPLCRAGLWIAAVVRFYTAVFRFSDPNQYLVANASLQCVCQSTQRCSASVIRSSIR